MNLTNAMNQKVEISEYIKIAKCMKVVQLMQEKDVKVGISPLPK